MSTTYKIHPSIGVARVGDSESYYLGPEQAGGLPTEMNGSPVTQFRDSSGGMKRQAARFRILAYDSNAPGADGRLIQPGQGGVKDIEWKVHLANKKSAWYEFQQQQGADGNYSNHPLRNPRTTEQDRNKLIIDPGPQTITCLGTQGKPTQAEFSQGKGQAGYTQTWPPVGLLPEGNDITTLGSIFADSAGYLYTLGGFGKSGVSKKYDITSALLDTLDEQNANGQQGPLPSSILQKLRPIADLGYDTQADFEAAIRQALGAADYNTYIATIEQQAYPQPRLDTYANNPFWWDDVSDGPVTATLIMDDNSRVEVTAPAWVMVGPPAYAPQIFNMITLYDTMYDAIVRGANYNPALYSNGQFNPSYRPNLQAELQPLLSRPSVYKWVANINEQGVAGHDNFTRPSGGATNFFDYIRKPDAYNSVSPGLMPKLAGDNPINGTIPKKYLVLTDTQYFLLSQYNQGLYDSSAPSNNLSNGEQLDRAVLENCVGGAFCPGIEMTWVSRDVRIYSEPFRLKHRPTGDNGLSWNTNPHDGLGLEPGDATKYMAQPWQADFNECSNQYIDHTSIWWWPAQRPYYVNYRADDGSWAQGYWTRPADINFNKDETMVYNWKNLGFIVQTQQSGAPKFAEVERLPLVHLDTDGSEGQS